MYDLSLFLINIQLLCNQLNGTRGSAMCYVWAICEIECPRSMASGGAAPGRNPISTQAVTCAWRSLFRASPVHQGKLSMLPPCYWGLLMVATLPSTRVVAFFLLSKYLRLTCSLSFTFSILSRISLLTHHEQRHTGRIPSKWKCHGYQELGWRHWRHSSTSNCGWEPKVHVSPRHTLLLNVSMTLSRVNL